MRRSRSFVTEQNVKIVSSANSNGAPTVQKQKQCDKPRRLRTTNPRCKEYGFSHFLHTRRLRQTFTGISSFSRFMSIVADCPGGDLAHSEVQRLYRLTCTRRIFGGRDSANLVQELLQMLDTLDPNNPFLQPHTVEGFFWRALMSSKKLVEFIFNSENRIVSDASHNAHEPPVPHMHEVLNSLVEENHLTNDEAEMLNLMYHCAIFSGYSEGLPPRVADDLSRLDGNSHSFRSWFKWSSKSLQSRWRYSSTRPIHTGRGRNDVGF